MLWYIYLLQKWLPQWVQLTFISLHSYNCFLIRTFKIYCLQFSSVHSVVSDSLWPHESQHTRSPCPLPTPGVYSNSCPLSRWCHPTISSSVVPFSSCPQSLPASGVFQWLSSSHEVAKVLEFQLQHQSSQWTPRTDLLRMDWLDLLAVWGTLKSFLQPHSSKASIFWHSAFYSLGNFQIYSPLLLIRITMLYCTSHPQNL